MRFLEFDRFFALVMTMNLASTLVKTLLFSLVGVCSFAIWTFCSPIFQPIVSLYTACAIVFIIFGGAALLPFTGENTAKSSFRTIGLFAVSFVVFAIFWCMGWFSFRNHFGEILGSTVGIFALTAIFRAGLSFQRSTFEAACVVFFSYTLGYYMGEKAYQELGGIAGKLLWGWGFGLGMGFGLSYLISLDRAQD